MTTTIPLHIRLNGNGRDDVLYRGQPIVKASRQPYEDACRAMYERGYSADETRLALIPMGGDERNPEAVWLDYIRVGLNSGVKETATGRKRYYLSQSRKGGAS